MEKSSFIIVVEENAARSEMRRALVPRVPYMSGTGSNDNPRRQSGKR